MSVHERAQRRQPLTFVSSTRLLLLLPLLLLLLSSSSWVFASLEIQLSDDLMSATNENDSIIDDESESLRRILWNTHQIQRQIKSFPPSSLVGLPRPLPSNILERTNKKDNKKLLRNVTLFISLPCEYFPNDNMNQTSSFQPLPPTSSVMLVQESTSSLMAAKAFAKTVLQKTNNNKNNNDKWNLLLDDKAWDILDSLLLPPFSTRNVDDDDDDDNDNDKNDNNDNSDLYFQTQGLLPKYWYYNPLQSPKSNNNNKETFTPYINGTRIPHWSLFVPKTTYTNNHTSNHTHHNSTHDDFIRSSFRLSALPLHASLLWDMMVAVIPPNTDHSSDLNDNDNLKSSYPYSYNYEHNREWWNRIERYYAHIFQHHMYLHHVVMRGCQASSSKHQQQQQQQDFYLHQDQNQKPSPSHHSNRPTVPCYNILHPWESLMDPTSPTWEIVLQPIMQHIRDTKWQLPFVIPPFVEQSFDFPGNPLVYKAMIYLLVEGWVRKEFVVGNSTTTLAGMCQSSPSPATCAEDALLFWNTTTTNTTTTDDSNNERDNNNKTTTTTTIPFAMLDVGFAAVLAQADSDLQQLARVLQMVLPENFYAADSARRTFEQDIATIQQWQHDNDCILQHELWNETHRTYLSKYYAPRQKQQKMVFVNAAVSNNLIPFWNTDALVRPNANNDDNNNQDGSNGDTTKASSSSSSSKSLVEVRSKTNNNKNNNIIIKNHPANDDAVASTSSTSSSSSSWSETTRNHWKDLTLLLLRRDNRFAFDCGSFPIWSLGCQEEYHDSATQKPPMIQPIVNYLVATGLLQNAEYLDTFGQYMSSQTLRLFYHDNNQKPDRHHPYHHVENTTTSVFAEAFSAFYPNHNLAHDICGNTSTLTAAIVYNFRVPDPTHANRLPLPPIRRSWVITLITAELFVAFSIGVSCLLLSFSQYRKLLRDSTTTIGENEAVGDSAANDTFNNDEEIVALNHRDYQDFSGGNSNDHENESSNNNNNSSNNRTANYDATTVINATSSPPPAPNDSRDATQPETSRSFFARYGFY